MNSSLYANHRRKASLLRGRSRRISEPLNALDRCVRYGAQAYVRAVLATGGELMFCTHHVKEYPEKLAAVAVKIQDESERLVESK